jgi:hypothetical protein
MTDCSHEWRYIGAASYSAIARYRCQHCGVWSYRRLQFKRWSKRYTYKHPPVVIDIADSETCRRADPQDDSRRWRPVLGGFRARRLPTLEDYDKE